MIVLYSYIRTWKPLCSSFGPPAHYLPTYLVDVSCCICTTSVHSDSQSDFVACHPTLLDKWPDVQPTYVNEVGEIPSSIIAEAALGIGGHNVEKAAGSHQVCASQVGEYEGAVYAMHQIFLDPERESVASSYPLFGTPSLTHPHTPHLAPIVLIYIRS